MPYNDDKNPNAITNSAIRTPWPRIGGAALKIGPNPFFDDPAFLEAWKPGRRGIVYAAGCEGTYQLARRLSMPVFKVGFTTTSLRDRLAHLGGDRYGAGRIVDGMVLIEPGHDEWAAAQIRVTLPLSPMSPVLVMSRGIGVTLPATYAVRDFDRDLSAALSTVEVVTFVRTDIGRAHCDAVGIAPAEALRVTAYDFASDMRVSQARELAIFRPGLDGDRLVVTIEALVATHLQAVLQARPAAA